MIKRSDGKPFVLRKPNPIMLSQDIWDWHQTHNMIFEEVSYVPRSIHVKNKPIVEKPPIIEDEPEQLETITEESGPITLALPEMNPSKLFCYVLPTVYKVTTDSVFGEKTTRLVYGQKFTTELSIQSITADTFATFWTNGFKEINKGSIIFVSSDKRWWKVNSFRQAPEGIFIDCITSDQTPSFA